MKTYDQRMADILKKAKRAKAARRTLRISVSVLGILAIVVCVSLLWPRIDGFFHPIENPGPAGSTAVGYEAHEYWQFDWDEIPQSLRIIRSYDDLIGQVDAQTLEKYNSEFFQDHTLLLIGFSEPGLGFDHPVTAVWQLPDGSYQIEIHRIQPGGMAAMIAFHTVCVELDAVISADAAMEVLVTDYRRGEDEALTALGTMSIRSLNVLQIQQDQQAIIRSKDELQALLGAHSGRYGQYDEEYFKENTLVALLYDETGGPYYNTPYLSKKSDGSYLGEGDYHIQVNHAFPDILSECNAAGLVLVEIDQVVEKDADIVIKNNVLNENEEKPPKEPADISFRAERIWGCVVDPGTHLVIRTYDEWIAVAENWKSNSDFYERYNREFFEENTLVFVSYQESCLGFEHRVTGARKSSDGSYLIEIDRIIPLTGETVVDYLTVCIELNAAIEEDAQVVVQTTDRPTWLEGGESVPFTATYIRAAVSYASMIPGVFDSVESVAAYLGQMDPQNPVYQAMAQYDDAFFAENRLVIMQFIMAGDYGFLQVKDVVQNPNGTLAEFIIDLEYLEPPEPVSAGSGWTILLEVNGLPQAQGRFEPVSYVQRPMTQEEYDRYIGSYQIDPPMQTSPDGWDPDNSETCYPLIFVENGQAYVIGAVAPGQLYTPWDFLYSGLPLENFYGVEQDISVSTEIIHMNDRLALFDADGNRYESDVYFVKVKGEYATGDCWVKLILQQIPPDGLYFGSYSGLELAPENIAYGDRSICADMDSDGTMDDITWDFAEADGIYSYTITIACAEETYTIQRSTEYFDYEDVQILIADIDLDGCMELILYEKALYTQPGLNFFRGVSIYSLDGDDYEEVLYYSIFSIP